VNIVQITPGAGGMYCGNCFRDNAMVAALRRGGHTALMVPLYLPLTLEDEDSSLGTPIFFSGINVYLEQKSAFFRHAPNWLHHLLASRFLLKWASGRAAKTRAAEVGDLTLSMIRGEEGNQAREVEELITWLKGRVRWDVVCLSNALLVGLARRIKSELDVPVVCMLQGEDTFLDALPEPPRQRVWQTLAERARELDLFIAPSRYFADLMIRRLGLPPERVHVIHNGINLDGYSNAPASEPDSTIPSAGPTLGYFARMCREKGLDTLVESFILLKERGRVPHLKLRVGGGCGPADKPFVQELQRRLGARGLSGETEFHPNLDRASKLAFLQSLTVMSVPALYGEAFGLYVVEALASGVPVVQPRHAAFPELLEATGGGRICEPGDAAALAEAIEPLLLDPILARRLGAAGREAVFRNFGIDSMTARILEVYRNLLDSSRTGPQAGRPQR
jgi:glycosyltransferase involved in cell wall biosynthesis